MQPIRPIFLSLGIGALLLVIPAASSAAIRYASPGGPGDEHCNPDPCTLAKAVNQAKDGDQVVVEPGTYTPTSEVEVDHAIEVGGQPGAALPVIQISEDFFREKNAAAVVHDLRIEIVKETMPWAIMDESGTVERVYAYSFLSAGACEIESGTMRDSVCWGGLIVAGESSKGEARVVLRNVTATSTEVSASENTNLTVDGANLIVHSINPALSNGADLGLDISSGSSASIVLTHSNYATVDTSASSGTKFTFTAPGTNGNQTAPPQFVNIATGDVRELPSSPTVDAGLADSLIGATDLAGLARSQPACLGGTPAPDIGAYELVPTTPCAKPSNRFGFGKLKRNKKQGTAKLTVSVPGPGILTLVGPGLVAKSLTLTKAGNALLPIKLKGKRKRALARVGKLKVKAKITFKPTGGDPATQTKTVKLVRSAKRSARS